MKSRNRFLIFQVFLLVIVSSCQFSPSGDTPKSSSSSSSSSSNASTPGGETGFNPELELQGPPETCANPELVDPNTGEGLFTPSDIIFNLIVSPTGLGVENCQGEELNQEEKEQRLTYSQTALDNLIDRLTEGLAAGYFLVYDNYYKMFFQPALNTPGKTPYIACFGSGEDLSTYVLFKLGQQDNFFTLEAFDTNGERISTEAYTLATEWETSFPDMVFNPVNPNLEIINYNIDDGTLSKGSSDYSECYNASINPGATSQPGPGNGSNANKVGNIPNISF